MAAPFAPPVAPAVARKPLDAARITALLDRLEAALAGFDRTAAALAAAVRSGDAAALATAGEGHRTAAAALHEVAADRAALLGEHAAPSLSRLAADSRLVHLASRCGSLAGSLRETRRRVAAVRLASSRAAAGCGAVRDLLARGGRRASAYTPTGAEHGGGGVLFDAAA